MSTTITLNHINIVTQDMARMSRFYQDILGFEPGYRPPSKSTGIWLYQGETALIHLVQADQPCRNDDPQINHFALSASGFASYMATLRKLGVAYKVQVVPAINLHQVKAVDPDGNIFEVLFSGEDTQDVDLSPFTLE